MPRAGQGKPRQGKASQAKDGASQPKFQIPLPSLVAAPRRAARQDPGQGKGTGQLGQGPINAIMDAPFVRRPGHM
ncbi:unnamed protein product [Clonostachys solani]|uniref:Uncharacterized protein n=1 Tax=Clonostachys solani TaxID=160281 RepID=A0A9N9Z7P3_9HYPO|nr:unnamed protein product [Clonostachys solani]